MEDRKKVLITGVTGQDGSLMADYLLNNTDNIVVGGIRRLSVKNHKNIEHLADNDRFKLIDLDVADQINVENVIQEEKPDYFINFAANSFVGNSWDMPVNHMMTNAMAVLYQLDAIRKYVPDCRYYNAGSSEQFGDVDYSPQDIEHPFKPRSPYGVSKCAAHHLIKVWRESYNIYAVQGILFNHEGVRRGEEFVTRKISKAVAEMSKALEKGYPIKRLELGNLDAKRDWSDAEDFMDGVWKMLNQNQTNGLPKDYVLASGQTNTIRSFVEEAFWAAGIKYCSWRGEGIEETYCLAKDDGEEMVVVSINPKFYRPAEVELLLGNSMPARKELDWQPKTHFKNLVRKMVESDLSG